MSIEDRMYDEHGGEKDERYDDRETGHGGTTRQDTGDERDSDEETTTYTGKKKAPEGDYKEDDR